jgi:carbamoyltransferase
MYLLGIHSGYHDACAVLFEDYRMVAAVALERFTRRKIDGGRVPMEAIVECLEMAGIGMPQIGAVAVSRGPFPSRYFSHFPLPRMIENRVREAVGLEKQKSMERECVRYGRTDSAAMFNSAAFLRDLGCNSNIPLSFYNHHASHALATLFHTDWDEALLYTADGGGDNVQYSHRLLKHGRLATLYGGDEGLTQPMKIDSLGLAYGYATQALGFRINKHEGKLTGLAALGEPALASALAAHFRIDADGRIDSDFASYPEMRRWIFGWAEGHPREIVAASVQKVLEDFITEAVRRLLKKHDMRKLGLSGGVFANVKLNQRLAEELPVDEVFIYPAMSDQGLAAGGVLQHLLERDGLETWLKQRYRLDHLYLGRDYSQDIDPVLAGAGARLVSSDPVQASAALLNAGKVVAIYTKGMEYGPRALGARTIMGAPLKAEINQTLNERLDRSEFMPFAPVVRDVDATRIFKLPPQSLYAARFMTITCQVQEEWIGRIPAVVHVDGTARPQVIRRDDNPLYYDILSSYAELSGVPVLINTSFNVHEEPIINSPAECLRALQEGRIDYVVSESAVWEAAPKA